jgi:hypothetical protein
MSFSRYGVSLMVLMAAVAFGGGESGEPPQAGAAPMKFKRVGVVDKDGIGTEAFSLLVPAGWEVEGGVQWRLDNPAFPAYGAVKVRNPRGTEEFEVFPNLPFFWTNNPMVMTTNPPGSKYFGNVVRQPVGAEQALRQIVLPAFRGGVGEVKVAEAKPVPELAKMAREAHGPAQPGVNVATDAARVRVEYEASGRKMEEEIYGVVQTLAFSMNTFQGVVVNQNWWVDYLFSFKAEKGKLDASAGVLQTVAFSFRINKDWYNRYVQLVEMLIQRQIRQIRQIGEISRMISQTSREISEDRQRRWEKDQAVRDRMNEEYSRYVRGVDAYNDPNKGGPVELPAGYGNAWSNKLGEYIVTESPGYNPNEGSNVEWTRLELRR